MDKKLKIGWFLTVYGALGGVRSVIETGNSLIRMGHEFFLLGNVGKHKSTFCEDLIPEKNHIAFSLHENEEHVKQLCSNYYFDIIFNQDPATMGYHNCVNSQIKAVHYCGGDGSAYEQYIETIDSIRTACSYDLFETAKRHDHDNRYKEYFIGQGINFDQFYHMDIDNSIYKRFNNKEKINVLCCGSRGGGRKSNKGTYDMICASELLNKEKYNFIYFDLTKQDFPNHFMCIETIQKQKNLADVYAVADIFVAPDYVSAWNCCAGEAMACNKPIICSTRGIQDFCINGENCLIYQENVVESPKILAEKIEILANDVTLRNKIRENGHNGIKRFTWDSVANNIVNLCKKELNLP
ncbi:MAG: glycosyltransferase [bacterium]|nr:glycosyltransferase [bacterium]